METKILILKPSDNIATAVRFSKNIKYLDEEGEYTDISQTNTLEKQIEEQEPYILSGLGKMYTLYYVWRDKFVSGLELQQIYVIVKDQEEKSLKEMLEFLIK